MELPTYWHIELYSGELIKVSPNPEKIKRIQKLIASQTGAITTPDRSIVVKDIKDFRKSDIVYVSQKLLESGAAVFGEALFNEQGEIRGRYVKKSVPLRRWDSHYRHISAYRLLAQSENSATMAFMLPAHQINHHIVQELTPEEERLLAK